MSLSQGRLSFDLPNYTNVSSNFVSVWVTSMAQNHANSPWTGLERQDLLRHFCATIFCLTVDFSFTRTHTSFWGVSIQSVKCYCTAGNILTLAALAAYGHLSLKVRPGSALVGTLKHIRGQRWLISRGPTFEKICLISVPEGGCVFVCVCVCVCVCALYQDRGGRREQESTHTHTVQFTLIALR